jgi:hypothetical protein
MTIDARTPAEIAYDAIYTPLSPAWDAALDITADPTCAICGAAEDCDCDDSSAKERQPVPPVPFGYPLDRAMIYQAYGETFISIDRRDGELLICNTCKTAGDEEQIVILSPARALALYRFFSSAAMVELMDYHRKNAAPLAG